MVITPYQLKLTNTIFLEHQEYTEKIPMLYSIIKDYERKDSNYRQLDSIRVVQLTNAQLIIEAKNDSINDLQKSVKKASRLTKIKNICLGIETVLLIIVIGIGIAK